LVDDFCTRFMTMSCRDPAISEDHQIQLFLTGLGQHLRMNVALQKPATLDDAVTYARAYEERDKFLHDKFLPAPAMFTSRSMPRLSGRSQTTPTHSTTTSGPSVILAASSADKPTTKRLSPTQGPVLQV
jgi:hypothetical protein